MNKAPAWVFLPQFVAAAILGVVAALKFSAGDNDVAIFTELGMEPAGRILIAVIEAMCALLLLTPYAAIGAALAIAVMMGAIIAHATVIGFIVDGDGGKHIMLLCTVLVSCLLVCYVRRRELPIIGDSL